MRVLTRRDEDGIAKALTWMHELVDQIAQYGDAYNEMMSAIRDIAEHVGGEAEREYLSCVWDQKYVQALNFSDEQVHG